MGAGNKKREKGGREEGKGEKGTKKHGYVFAESVFTTNIKPNVPEFGPF